MIFVNGRVCKNGHQLTPPLAAFWILSPLFLRFTQNPLFLSNIFYLKSSKKHSWCYFEQNLHPWLLERKWHNLTMYTGIIGKVSSKQSNFLPGEEWSSYRSISQGRQVSHHHVQCLIFKMIRGRIKKKMLSRVANLRRVSNMDGSTLNFFSVLSFEPELNWNRFLTV